MLYYAVMFFVIALVAALFGFGGLASGAVAIGKILFLVFAVLALATFLYGLLKNADTASDRPSVRSQPATPKETS